MKSFDVENVRCGSPEHLADLQALQERQLAIPHDYSSWPLHSREGTWVWCRVLGGSGQLITGFAIQLTLSRAMPGTRIGRIERVGRELHEELADSMGAVLTEAARKVSRLLYLDVRVFDEDPLRRHRLCDSLAAAGWTSGPERRQYQHTLVLKLAASTDEVLKGFSTRVRRTIKKAVTSPAIRIEPVIGDAYTERVRHLCTLAFARTGSALPPIDVEGIFRDSASGTSSFLIGAFAREVQPPEDLVAVLWGRRHGDHVTVEVNASDRSELFHKLSPGFGLMSELIDWSIRRNAHWIDMGGLSCLHPAAEDPMRGIIEFKTRFSSDFREVAEEWRLTPNPMLASAAKAVSSIARSMGGS